MPVTQRQWETLSATGSAPGVIQHQPAKGQCPSADKRANTGRKSGNGKGNNSAGQTSRQKTAGKQDTGNTDNNDSLESKIAIAPHPAYDTKQEANGYICALFVYLANLPFNKRCLERHDSVKGMWYVHIFPLTVIAISLTRPPVSISQTCMGSRMATSTSRHHRTEPTCARVYANTVGRSSISTASYKHISKKNNVQVQRASVWTDRTRSA